MKYPLDLKKSDPGSLALHFSAQKYHPMHMCVRVFMSWLKQSVHWARNVKLTFDWVCVMTSRLTHSLPPPLETKTIIIKIIACSIWHYFPGIYTSQYSVSIRKLSAAACGKLYGV